MASDNEKRAAALGISLKAYKASDEYKVKKSIKSSKEDEKKAKKKIEKYYKEEKGYVEKKASTETQRLQEDMTRIIGDLGITKTRTIEDYIRNIGNLNESKAADVDDLNYYVSTAQQRTGEDLDTALMKESRRFGLEQERINESLADAGLTFSERRPEQIAKEESAINVSGVQREANRSFQDIARYETAKNRDIELKYGQLTEEANVSKKRTLEDILNEKQAQTIKNQRGIQDIAFGKAKDIRDTSYGRDTDVASTGQLFSTNRADLENYNLLNG